MQNSYNHFIELLWEMTIKELQARYKHTFFGFLWLILNPLLQMLVIGFIFSFFMKEPIQYYYVYLFIGLLTWNFFSTSLIKATPSIVYERSLIKKAIFPRSVIPLSIVFSNAINLIIALFILIISVSFTRILTIWTLPYIFIATIGLVLFTSGICLLTSALNVRFRDINFFVQALLLIWFYATPVVYSLTQIPTKILWLWRMNPLTSILQLYHYSLIGGTFPETYTIIGNFILALIISFAGIVTFYVENKNFDDWV